MKKIVLFLVCSNFLLFSETFWFEFLDPMSRTVSIEQCKDPFNEILETIITVQSYNSPVFLIERLDFDYRTTIGSLNFWDRRVKGRVELLENCLEFIPDDPIHIENQTVISVFFYFYGQSFRYSLVLDPDYVEVKDIRLYPEITELDDLGKYIYVMKEYEYDGVYIDN